MSGAIPPLEALGPRIMILGASNAGKSTLAEAIARKAGHRPVHLDQLRFAPNSDWVERTDADFIADHDDAITGDSWVIDGNYGIAMPQRLARATGMIVLWDSRWPAFARFVRRTLFEPRRIGGLKGGRDSIKWSMVRWILIEQPKRRGRGERFAEASGLPWVRAYGMREVGALYKAWGLERRRAN